MTFGILSDWPGTSAYHNEIVRGIEEFGRQSGISLITLAVGRFGSDKPFELGRTTLYNFLKGDAFSGLIAFTASVGIITGPEAYLRELSGLTRKPVISLTVPVKGFPSVIIDNKSGFSDLCRHLILDHGITDFVFVAGPKDNYDSGIRLEVFRKELSEAGLSLPDERVYHGDYTARSGADAVHYFADELKIHPRAVVCANDYMAIGVWEEAKNHGWILPLDTAVTGFDNIEMSRWFELPFTTVRQPFYQQGFEAARLLQDVLLGRRPPPVTVIPTKMVRRESCGCLIRDFASSDKGSPVDKASVIRILHGERLDIAFNHFMENKPGDPMIRAWNAFINETRVLDLKESEVRRYFNELSDKYCSKQLTLEKKSALGKNLLRMQQIMGDYYKEADLFGKVIEGVSFEQAMEGIDNFTQWLMTTRDPAAQAGRLKELFLSLGIRNAWLVLYTSPEDPFSGFGKCVFAMVEGETRSDEMEEFFNLAEILPPGCEYPEWTSLVTEALYEGSEQIGYVLYDHRRWDADTNEMLRRRLSSGLRAVQITKNLSDINENLQEEIRLRKESEQKLVKLMEELKNLSLKDDLTGLFNRRGFLTIGEQQIKHYLREKKDFLVLFADMDGLKSINDTWGHREGDFAIQTAARILEASFREADIVARLGGDEFTVLLGSASPPHMELFRDRIEKTSLALSGGSRKDYRISLSLGFVAASEYPGATLSELLDHADRNLYEEKKVRKQDTFSL